MKRCPASFIFDFDEEDTRAILIFTKDHEGKHEYIRRDLIQTILIRVHLHEARRDDIKLDQIIDEVIQHHENKPTQNDN